MTTIAVDFNDLVRGGQVLAFRDGADGPVSIGDTVTAVDEAEDMRFEATVDSIEGDKVYLVMHWKPAGLPAKGRFSAVGNRLFRVNKKVGIRLT